MGTMKRGLALAGLTLTAGMAFTASPALAATATPAAKAPVSVSKVQTPQRDRDRIVGYYRTLRACDAAGRQGEHRHRWDDYDCTRVKAGGRRGTWALQAHWGSKSHHDTRGHH